MQSEHQSLFQIPYRTEVPFETRHAVIEERISAEHSRVRRVGENAKTMKAIVEEYRDRAINLMGGDKYERFRAYVKDQKRIQAKLLFHMPTPGLVEVWIEAMSKGSHHHLSLWDEWGWSDSSVNQHDYLTLKASSAGSASELQRSEMSWFSTKGYTDGYWDNHYLTDGATYWANLVSDPGVLIPAGSWVLVEVGMLNFNSSLANDVEVYSNLDFSWIIKSVSVHSTGG